MACKMKAGAARTALVSSTVLTIMTTTQAIADPNLNQRFEIDGVTLFPDQSKSGLFYYAPLGLRIAHRDGKPIFAYNVFRYVGRHETGDAGVFRVRGVLTFDAVRIENTDLLRKVLNKLHKRRVNARLQPAPIKKFRSKLIYKTIEGDSKPDHSNNTQSSNNNGVIEGGISKPIDVDQEGNWEERGFTIGLKPKTTELFWDNFANNRLQISLSYDWKLLGVVPDEAEKGNWRVKTIDDTDTLPIEVSMRDYPSLFKRVETWQKLDMGHTNVVVLCYDFINEVVTDLYSVSVDVMFRTLRNQDYVETVKFTSSDDAFEKQISFRLAKDIDEGYKYRIHRIYKDGRVDTTAWKEFKGQQLDVTIYNN